VAAHSVRLPRWQLPLHSQCTSSSSIDHWDNEREKILILTELSLFVVSYDFINAKILDWDRIFLHRIISLQFGDLVYPEKSMMP
jgi:hypothetical protein